VKQSSADDLLKALGAALEHDARVDWHHYPVRAALRDGALVLEGTLESIIAKKVVARTARQIAEDVPLVDRLRVMGAEPKGDGALRDEVVHTLLDEPAFMECGLQVAAEGEVETLRDVPGNIGGEIKASIVDGVVTLSGRVGSLSHRRLAEVLVWWTAGCEAVDNRLEVVPPEDDNDGEMTDAVRIVLEKDPLVHASQLAVSSQAGVVTLDGYVASTEEKTLVVLDTWYVPGVHDVVDRIEARS